MKKYVVCAIIVAVSLLSACGTIRQDNEMPDSLPTEAGSPANGDINTIPVGLYENFTDVENLVEYLGLDEDSLIVLTDNQNELVFCFAADDVDYRDESTISYWSYVKILETEGYEFTGYDATISVTFKLENDQYIIKITVVGSDYIDEWKSLHQDSLANAELITNENIIYELHRK